MIGHRAGEWVEGGSYWSLSTGECNVIPKEGGILPGKEGERYFKAPLVLALVVGPLAGLGYVIFLPLIGILTLAWFLARKVVRILMRAERAAVHAVATPASSPEVSHRVERDTKSKEKTAEPKETEELDAESILAALEKEIAAKRQKKE